VNILVCIHSQFAVWNIPQSHVDRLRAEFPSHTFLHALDDNAAVELIANAEAAFMGQLTREQLLAAHRLRWIHSPAAGVGGMLFPEMHQSPIVITNSKGMSAETIAEHVLAVTLAIFRRLPHAFRSQAQREWAQDAIAEQGNRTIAGSRVLVIGLGGIGQAVARRMTLLGAHVTGIRRDPNQKVDHVAEVAPPSSLLRHLGRADVVVIAAPHTRETRGLIDAPAVAAMSPETVVVNVSRGALVDEAALAAALRERQIAAAALDVFEDEPLPSNSPLWNLENVVITPHTSGFRLDHWDAATALFAANLRRFEAGEPLANVVDKELGY
jgi:phosphoglycerate dehydrogenase-like enzyme